MFTKIVSGGQTGVDRAALDVALALGLASGGWCPRGRKAEDGPLPKHYPLQETPWDGYPQRTEWNIRDSDGTLILHTGAPDRGTALTIALVLRRGKPCLEIDLTGDPDAKRVREWAGANQVRILNVAGPRESSARGIYAAAVRFLRDVLSEGSYPE